MVDGLFWSTGKAPSADEIAAVPDLDSPWGRAQARRRERGQRPAQEASE